MRHGQFAADVLNRLIQPQARLHRDDHQIQSVGQRETQFLLTLETLRSNKKPGIQYPATVAATGSTMRSTGFAVMLSRNTIDRMARVTARISLMDRKTTRLNSSH